MDKTSSLDNLSGETPMRFTLISLFTLSLITAAAQAQYVGVKPQRVDEIASMLPDHAQAALAPACSNRASWQPMGATLSEQIAQAKAYVGKPFPAWSDEDYLDYYTSGSRDRSGKMMQARTSWLVPLVLAECAEWNGAYLKTISMVLDELASQKSWAMPAHDVDKGYITGKRYFVELLSADLANNLATTLFLLGDKIPAATRKHVMDALETRVFQPMRASYTTGKGQTWLRVESNWNAVCLAGVTGAALAALPDKHDRAFFVAAAEYYQRYYMNSFPADGFEVEGIGYWNYGFSNYAVLREELWRATRGKIDIFQDEKVQKAARFGVDFQMLPGVIAYFSDAHYGEQPNGMLSAYISRTFGLPEPQGKAGHSAVSFPFQLMTGFPIKSPVASSTSPDTTLRVFYPVAGVLVSKPRDSNGIAATIKALGNGPHSHNDVGSYAIGLGHAEPLGEPGGPSYYTSQTFSKDRFLSKLLNSYGHPVPVIDGHLQKDALKVKAPVIASDFSAQKDVLSIDMTDAYEAPTLKRLVRTMTHTREGRGVITLRDTYSLSAATTVDEALITLGDWKQIDGHTLSFTLDGETAMVTIASPSTFTIKSERIDEYGRPFTRVAFQTTMKDGDSFELRIAPSDR